MPATHSKPTINYGHPLGKGLLAWWLGEPDVISPQSQTWRDLTGRVNARKGTNSPPSGDGALMASNWNPLRGNKPVYKSTGNWDLRTDFNPLSATTQFTLSMWYKKRLTSSGIGLGSTEGSYISAVGIGVVSSVTYLYCSTGGAGIYGGFSDAQTNWTHIIYSYNGACATNATRMVCYKNGAAQTLSITGTVPSVTRTFSNATNSYLNLFSLAGVSTTDGCVDSIFVWNRALSATEMKLCYDNSLLNFPGLISNPISVAVKSATAAGNRRRRALLCGAAN